MKISFLEGIKGLITDLALNITLSVSSQSAKMVKGSACKYFILIHKTPDETVMINQRLVCAHIQKFPHLVLTILYATSPVYNISKQTSVNGFLGLSNVSSWIKNKFIDETRHHSSKHWTKPINLHQIRTNRISQ